jgi:hypothetical protein
VHNFINRVFISAVRCAGIPDFRFHDLRHTFVPRLAMRGINLPTVEKLMGHPGTRMTERHAHLSDQRLRDAMELLGATCSATKLCGESRSDWAVQVSNLRPSACKTAPRTQRIKQNSRPACVFAHLNSSESTEN